MMRQLELLHQTCRSCGARVIWAVVDRSGRRIPLDAEFELEPTRRGAVAYNAETGRCHVMTTEDHHLVPTWIRAGATFHRAHFSTCPHSDHWRMSNGIAEPA
jgi:hypothetical protein